MLLTNRCGLIATDGVLRGVTYFVVSEEPEPRGLVVFVVGDVQVVRPGLQDGVLAPGLGFGFGFDRLAGVQGGLRTI